MNAYDTHPQLNISNKVDVILLVPNQGSKYWSRSARHKGNKGNNQRNCNVCKIRRFFSFLFSCIVHICGCTYWPDFDPINYVTVLNLLDLFIDFEWVFILIQALSLGISCYEINLHTCIKCVILWSFIQASSRTVAWRCVCRGPRSPLWRRPVEL